MNEFEDELRSKWTTYPVAFLSLLWFALRVLFSMALNGGITFVLVALLMTPFAALMAWLLESDIREAVLTFAGLGGLGGAIVSAMRVLIGSLSNFSDEYARARIKRLNELE